MIAKRFRAFLEGLGDDQVKLWTDAPGIDWPHIKHLFDRHGWPDSLRQSPAQLHFDSSIQVMRFQAAVENAFGTFKPTLRRHHTLDDAIANRYAWQRATARGF